MKPITKCGAQGDLYLRKVEAMPAGIKPVEPKDGTYILAHSETGHNHVIAATPNVRHYATDNPLVSYLEVIEATDAAEAVITHLRSWDTHAPINLSPGMYEIRNAREYTPAGWRRVQD